MSVATDGFKDITGYDIESFLNDYVSFINTDYSKIVNYYKGLDIDQDAFNNFDTLKTESYKIESLWEFYSNVFGLTDYWELLDAFSNAKLKLDTVDNLGRWMRSSRTDRYSQNTSITYVQKQGETIEKVAEKFGSVDKDNDWASVSIDNDLNEEKYTSAGGVILTVRLKNNYNFDINNIVDSLSNENLYGKDIQNKIEFIDGDVYSLAGENSLLQTISNIFNTFKGTIPEFPEDGIDSSIIGSNITAFSYPTQFRNIMQMLQKDDRFKTMELIDLYRTDDSVFIKVQLTTKIGDIFQQVLAI